MREPPNSTAALFNTKEEAEALYPPSTAKTSPPTTTYQSLSQPALAFTSVRGRRETWESAGRLRSLGKAGKPLREVADGRSYSKRAS